MENDSQRKAMMTGTAKRVWFFIPAMLCMMASRGMAQISPAPLMPQLAFSEAAPDTTATPVVSPLTPREPGSRQASDSRKSSAKRKRNVDAGIGQVSAPTGLLDDLLPNIAGGENCESCARPSCARRGCTTCEGGWCRRICCGMYDSVCCCNPCYEGCWLPMADAAFFTTAVRPVSQLRIRWNGACNVTFPDKAEFFWARADGAGAGPLPQIGSRTAARLRYQEARVYLETAIARFSIFVEAPYRSQQAIGADVGSGFGDVAAGFKTLFFDCELLQIGAQVRVETPTGDARDGLGTDHTSVEPSLLFGIRVTPHTYLQGQVAEWIPTDGDADYAGSVLHYHASLNQVLCRILPHTPLIGTAEFSGFTFHDGAYTDPVLGPLQPANGDTYLYAGGGLRLFICNAVDLGVAVRYALGQPHLEGTLYRAEFRCRF